MEIFLWAFVIIAFIVLIPMTVCLILTRLSEYLQHKKQVFDYKQDSGIVCITLTFKEFYPLYKANSNDWKIRTHKYTSEGDTYLTPVYKGIKHTTYIIIFKNFYNYFKFKHYCNPDKGRNYENQKNYQKLVEDTHSKLEQRLKESMKEQKKALEQIHKTNSFYEGD